MTTGRGCRAPFYLLRTYYDMEKFDIQIRVDVNYLEVECSPNTPIMLSDEIKALAKSYFSDMINQEAEI